MDLQCKQERNEKKNTLVVIRQQNDLLQLDHNVQHYIFRMEIHFHDVDKHFNDNKITTQIKVITSDVANGEWRMCRNKKKMKTDLIKISPAHAHRPSAIVILFLSERLLYTWPNLMFVLNLLFFFCLQNVNCHISSVNVLPHNNRNLHTPFQRIMYRRTKPHYRFLLRYFPL